MRVLVTGGSGFIGRYVVAEAAVRGHEVLSLSRTGRNVLHGVRHVRHDLRDEDGLRDVLRGVEGVVHCAALLDGSHADMQAVTVEGTQRLLAALDRNALRRFVLLSTFALYDQERLRVGEVLDEEAPLIEDVASRHPYIGAKARQEELVRASLGEALWTILRPGLVRGPGREWFFHLGTKRSPTDWVCLAPDALLPLTHVENCARAAVLALEVEDAGGTVLNVVDDDLPTRREYVEALASDGSPRPSIRELPWAKLDKLARRMDWVRRVLTCGLLPLPGVLDPAALAARCKPLRYTNERARTALGWTPAPFPFTRKHNGDTRK